MHLRVIAEEFEKAITRKGHIYPFQDPNESVDWNYQPDGVATQNTCDWIRNSYRDSRGAELPGTINSAVMQSLFRQQSRGWEKLAEEFINCALDAIRNYNESECARIERDEHVRIALRCQLDCWTVRALEKTRSELYEFLKDEREGILQTVNRYLADTLSHIREERVLARLHGLGIENGSSYKVDIQKLAKAAQ